MSLYKSLPISERYKLHQLYQKAYPNMRYRDRILHFEQGRSAGWPPDKEYDNRTQLTQDEEYVFREWYKSLPRQQYGGEEGLKMADQPNSYDFRGNWKYNEGEYEMQEDGYHMPSYAMYTGKALKFPDDSPSWFMGISGSPNHAPTIDLNTGQWGHKPMDLKRIYPLHDSTKY